MAFPLEASSLKWKRMREKSKVIGHLEIIINNSLSSVVVFWPLLNNIYFIL